MKKSLLVIIIFVLFVCCNKDKEKNNPAITGTVQQQGGCLPNTCLVLITSSQATKYPFLCDSPNPVSSLNCSNSVYIIGMPASLTQLGKRIKFSKWTDWGGYCLSSSYAPHHIEVSDLSAE